MAYLIQSMPDPLHFTNDGMLLADKCIVLIAVLISCIDIYRLLLHFFGNSSAVANEAMNVIYPEANFKDNYEVRGPTFKVHHADPFS